MSDGTITRRELFRRGSAVGGGLLTLPLLLNEEAEAALAGAAAAGAAGLSPGANVYESIGVRPLINARGTFTIISGSTMLPEVRAAMDAASRRDDQARSIRALECVGILGGRHQDGHPARLSTGIVRFRAPV